MKTKRTLFSIIVFLSVFWISILLGLGPFLDKKADVQVNDHPQINVDHSGSQTTHESSLNTLSDRYSASIASTSERLYIYQESSIDEETDKETDNANTTDEKVPIKELSISDPSHLQEKPRVKDKPIDIMNMSIMIEKDLLPDVKSEITQSVYSDIGISIAKTYVNIRDKATTESESKGKLYKDSAARILETLEDWYYVESGSVKGYVAKDYIKTGISDEELIEKYGKLRVSINTEGLNVREHANIESDKVTVVYKNEIYPVIDLYDEWLKIDVSDDMIIGYVNREYVDLIVDFENAISKKEEEELKKLREEERVKKETEVKYRDEEDYSKDELKLLACLVHAEAGNQSYDGKLAVANVVINRVKSSKYPNTINAVIYQPGQFTVAKSGSLAKQLDKYENYSTKSQLLTIKAAKAALSGANNIGTRLYFNAYASAVNKGYDKKKNSVKIEDHLFW